MQTLQVRREARAAASSVLGKKCGGVSDVETDTAIAV